MGPRTGQEFGAEINLLLLTRLEPVPPRSSIFVLTTFPNMSNKKLQTASKSDPAVKGFGVELRTLHSHQGQFYIKRIQRGKPEVRGFYSRWGHWVFFIDIILPAAPWP